MATNNFAQTNRKNKYVVLFISFSLCLVIFALYWQTLHHKFVFDDKWYIVENKTVSQGLTLQGLRWAFTLTDGALRMLKLRRAEQSKAKSD